MLFVERLDEHAGQQNRILGALAQGRDANRKRRQAINKILAHAAVGDRLSRIAIGRSENSHIGWNFTGAAYTKEFAGLEHAQQSHLQIDRHFGDLVEEERTPVRALEESLVQSRRAGKASLLVTEQLGLDQVSRDRTAIQREKWCIGTRALVVDGAGNQFLTASAFADNEHRCAGRRDAVDGVVERFHSR